MHFPMSLPAYIDSPAYHIISQAAENYDKDDCVLHISYNVLLPQEIEEYKRSLCLWINSNDAKFPLLDEQVLFLRNFAKLGPGNALSGPFAVKIVQHLQEGYTVEESAEKAFQFLEKEIAPRYLSHANTITTLKNTAQDLELKSQYQALEESLLRCGNSPRDALKNYYTQRILAYKNDEDMLNLLLTGSIGRNPIDSNSPSPLRPSDYWQQRKNAIFQTIDKVQQVAPKAAFILALQEVTPSMIPDFKEKFETVGAKIVSYNNGTAKKVSEKLADNEKMHKESLTSTIVVSKDFEVIREELGELPTNSGIKRKILGVELVNIKTGKHLAVFTTHTDHIPSKELYINTDAKIHEFVENFTKQENLPFMFSGDLNAFPDKLDTISFIETLRNEGPFKGSHDYREGVSFHAPSAIAQSTFLGQPIDDFKTLIGKDGKVMPNALDHTFLSKELIPLFALRDAGVYDDKGNYVDPYEKPELWLECLKKRQTASDHFLNASFFQTGL